MCHTFSVEREFVHPRHTQVQKSREFEHGNVHWMVREVDAHKVPGARAETCLIFESADVIRRLWEFPKDWTALSDDALWRLGERGTA